MIALLGGCVADYKADKALKEKIDLEGAKVVIVTPADGTDSKSRKYAGSGRLLAAALQTVLEERGATVGNAPGVKRTITITPRIDMWEDRVTEWSGKSDLLEINLRVAEGGKTIDERTLRAKSKWVTFGGDHPQEMLTDLFRKWANNVFTKRKK